MDFINEPNEDNMIQRVFWATNTIVVYLFIWHKNIYTAHK